MKCCVAGCNYSSSRRNRYPESRISFHRFPSIDFWRQKWIKALKINQTTATQICSRHFEDQYFDHDSKKAKLSLVAVPTLNLGFDENELNTNAQEVESNTYIIHSCVEANPVFATTSQFPDVPDKLTPEPEHIIPSTGGYDQHPNMDEKTEVISKKCGEIFILLDDNCWLICDFCGENFFDLKVFRNHIKEHFPKSPKTIKRKRSIGYCNDIESFPTYINDIKEDNFIPDEKQYQETLMRIKREDSSERKPISSEMQDDLKSNIVGVLQCDAETQTNAEFLRLHENENTNGESLLTEEPDQCNQLNIRSELHERENTFSRCPNNIESLPGNSSDLNYNCSFCYQMFPSAYERKCHEDIHTGHHRPHKCHLCSKAFAQSGNLASHIRVVHRMERLHKCSVCEKRFCNKVQLDIHTREKHLPDTDPRRYFPCKQCDVICDTNRKLSYHKLHMHNTNSAKFACVYCQREFNSRQSIERHMPVHTGIQNFKCQHCSKRFSYAESKYRHQRKCLYK